MIQGNGQRKITQGPVDQKYDKKPLESFEQENNVI